MQTALVLGSTGLVGEILTGHLLKDDEFSNVITYVRKQSPVQSPKLLSKIVSFEEINESFEADVVFCCLGTTMKIAGSKEAFKKVDYEYPLKIARLQKSQSKKFVLISAFGANPDSTIFYNQVKGQTEAEIIKLNYESTIILRPSLIDGDREKKNQPLRPAERLSRHIFKVINPLLVGPLARLKSVSAERIALKMIEVAKSDQTGLMIVESENI